MDATNTSNNTDTLFVLKDAIKERLIPWGVERAAANGTPKLYYGALSVAVLTLGLLLFVEALRRQLDHSATGRPFFQAVLEGVYRELVRSNAHIWRYYLLQF